MTRTPEPDAAEVSSARDYYRKILPFYEKESVSRAHLAFWTAIAREARPGRILEIGSGLGRITAALARIAPAFGVDISLEMLSSSNRRASQKALLVASDARHAPFGPRFDLIVAPGDPISHMTTLEDRRRTLRAVRRQLAPGGLFVLEGLYRRRDGAVHKTRRIRHAEGVLDIEETWSPIGAGQMWRARYRYLDRRRDGSRRTMSAAFLARAWDPAAIRGLFRSCGLSIANLWGDFDRRPFRRDAERIVVLARPSV